MFIHINLLFIIEAYNFFSGFEHLNFKLESISENFTQPLNLLNVR